MKIKDLTKEEKIEILEELKVCCENSEEVLSMDLYLDGVLSKRSSDYDIEMSDFSDYPWDEVLPDVWTEQARIKAIDKAIKKLRNG